MIEPPVWSMIFFAAIIGFNACLMTYLLWRQVQIAQGFRQKTLAISALLFFLAFLTLWPVPIASGWVSELPMPRLMIIFALSLLGFIGLALSPVGKALAIQLSSGVLVSCQIFRLPLEFILHQWVLSGTIPETMTWTGVNWDVLTGAIAILTLPLFRYSTKFLWAFNSLGSILLLNVIRVAIMSAPFPFSWVVKPPLLLGLSLPYALIVPLCVGVALFFHLLLWRKLLGR